jgi:hypothetical protein
MLLKAGRRSAMPKCEACGNEYDKTFEVTLAGQRHVFDSFECAAHVLAPTCSHCGIRILGHGLEADGRFFCCDHCAEKSGVKGLRDRVDAVSER